MFLIDWLLIVIEVVLLNNYKILKGKFMIIELCMISKGYIVLVVFC